MNETSTPPPTAERPPWQERRLIRSRDDRMVAGVAGGIAHTYRIDPTLVRLGFVVGALLGGAGIVFYLVAWLLVPETGPGISASNLTTDHHPWRVAVGAILLVVGGSFVVGHLLWYRGDRLIWPFALIGAGALVLWLRGRDDDHPSGDGRPSSAPPTWSAASTPSAPTNETASAIPSDARTAEPDAPPPPSSAWAPPSAWPTVPPIPPIPPIPRREHSPLGWITVSLVLIGLGVVTLCDAVGAITVNPGVVAASVLIAFGVAIVVGAFVGRARWLILLAVPIALLCAALAPLHVSLAGGFGDRGYAPTQSADLHSSYRLGIGRLDVDLSALELRPGTTHVAPRLGIGQLNVVVPDGAVVVVRGRADAGTVELFGHSDQGTQVDSHTRTGPRRARSTLEIDARVGYGDVRVMHASQGLR